MTATLDEARPDAPEPPTWGGRIQRAWQASPLDAHARRVVLGLGLSVLSGFLAVWSFEDFGVGALIWVAFVPAVVAQQRVLPRRWSGLALALAIGIMFQGYLGPGLLSSDLAWYLYLYGFWVGLAVLALTFRSRRFHERTGYRWFVLSTPLAWVAIDFVRTTQTEVFAGTWGMVAYALYERPAILQPVSVFGIHGMNLLVLLVNWAVAFAVLVWLDQHRGAVDDRPRLRWAAARPMIAGVAIAVATWMLASVAMLRSPEPELRAAAVQPGAFVADGQRRVPVLSPEEELERSIVQTRAAAAQGAELVVWREVGVDFDPSGPQGQVIRDLADELDLHLVVGWQAPVDATNEWSEESGRFVGGRYNESAAFGPDGDFLGSYGKSHPGEFAGDFSARQGEYLIYPAEWGNYGTIICFDLDFTDSARRTAELGANILAVPSSDVPGIAEKHYSHLVFRAIETRLPMVKADSAFDSAIIDPYGRVLASFVAKEGASATVIADVPLGSGDTLYVRWGEWFGWTAVLATVGLTLAAMRARRRREPTEEAAPGAPAPEPGR